MADPFPSIAVLTRQITHYHHPRFAAAARRVPRLDVISLANEGKFAEVLSADAPDGYALHRLYGGMQAYRGAVQGGALPAKVAQLLTQLSPDVVAISGWASPESYAALRWARAYGRGVVVMSDSRAEDAPRNWLRDRIKSRVLRACDSALAAGEAHRAYLRALGVPHERIRLGYDVVDNEYFREGAAAARADVARVRARMCLPERFILASGRFVPKKNFSVLIAAYDRACAGMADPPQLVIAGEGAERPALEAQIARLAYARVQLPGLFDYAQLPALYALSMGFVHVPVSEQWGLVVNEAAACGLPLLSSVQCGAAQTLVTHGENGWCVDAKDAGALAAALKELIALDPQSRAAMGRSSQANVADWGPERFACGLAQAARMAAGSDKRLTMLDQVIVRSMSRRIIETVA